MNCTELQTCANELIPGFEKGQLLKSLKCMSGPYAGISQAALLIIQFSGTRLLHYNTRVKLIECIPINNEKATIFLNGYSTSQKVSYVCQVAWGAICIIDLAFCQLTQPIYAGLKTPHYDHQINNAVGNCSQIKPPSNVSEVVEKSLNALANDYQLTSKIISFATNSACVIFTVVSVMSLFCLGRSSEANLKVRVLVVFMVAINLLAIALQAFSYNQAANCHFSAKSEISTWKGCYQNFTQGNL